MHSITSHIQSNCTPSNQKTACSIVQTNKLTLQTIRKSYFCRISSSDGVPGVLLFRSWWGLGAWAWWWWCTGPSKLLLLLGISGWWWGWVLCSWWVRGELLGSRLLVVVVRGVCDVTYWGDVDICKLSSRLRNWLLIVVLLASENFKSSINNYDSGPSTGCW